MLAHIAIDVPLNTLFTYRVSQGLKDRIAVGKRVLVGFRKKEMIGICVALEADDAQFFLKHPIIKPNTIKDVTSVLDEASPPFQLSEGYLQWLRFAADYYCAPIGQVLAQAIPPYYFDVKKIGWTKILNTKDVVVDAGFATSSVTLTTEQQGIFENIKDHFNEYYPALIHGITGSGKTEVYIQLIKHAFSEKKSALFLVPEIGLTPQMLSRLHHHFQGSLLVLHSSLTQNQRLNQWNRCLEGGSVVMIGTRSALFCPLPNLGVIIVDEEHDGSYKQDDRFRYNARDLAVSRAKLLKIPVILGSATPSLESYYLATQKKYHLFELAQRIGTATLPEIRVVDFNKEREQTGSHLLVSQSIHQAIQHFHSQREQMLLFVGQRGYAQNAYCVDCREIQLCPNCSVGLKYHKGRNLLKCHYCDFDKSFDEICIKCKKKRLTLLGFGTQTIEEEIRGMHPGLVIKRLDSDAAPTAAHFNEILTDFAKHKIDMIIGTQMITKGHDFGNIGFVGVLGIDTHLGLPEFRSAERAFQNIVQVAGRSGRATKKGHVIVQTLMPDHNPVRFGVAQDYKNFAAHELKHREALCYPPFARIIQVRFLSNEQQRLKEFLSGWGGFLNHLRDKTSNGDLKILGPAEMPLAKIRGKFRYHVLFKVKRGLKVQDLVRYVMADLDKRRPKGIQYMIDVDAQTLI